MTGWEALTEYKRESREREQAREAAWLDRLAKMELMLHIANMRLHDAGCEMVTQDSDLI